MLSARVGGSLYQNKYGTDTPFNEFWIVSRRDIQLHQLVVNRSQNFDYISPSLLSDEVWHQVDLAEATHCITQPQLLTKIEEVRKKAIMRGGGRIRTIKLLSEVVSDKLIRPPASIRELSKIRQERELISRSSLPDMKPRQESPLNIK
jgi:hypothetical protein